MTDPENKPTKGPMRTCVCVYVCIDGWYGCMYCMRVCMYACMHFVCGHVRTYMFACMYECTRVCICMCLYVCVYICTRTVRVCTCLPTAYNNNNKRMCISLSLYIYLSTFCISILMYCKCVNPKVSLAPGCGALLRTRPAHNALITFYLRPIRGRSGKSVWEHPSPTIRTRRIRTRALAGRTRRIRTHALAGEQARRASPLALGATCPFRGPTAWWSCLS